jgi:hypothetical protein
MKEEEKCRPSPSKKIKSNQIKEKKNVEKIHYHLSPLPKKKSLKEEKRKKSSRLIACGSNFLRCPIMLIQRVPTSMY